jgi:hypothetical protein
LIKEIGTSREIHATKPGNFSKRSNQFTILKYSASVIRPKYDIIFSISLQISFEKMQVLVCNRLRE